MRNFSAEGIDNFDKFVYSYCVILHRCNLKAERSRMKPESKDLLVFMIRRDSVCAECGEEIGRGRFITLEESGGRMFGCNSQKLVKNFKKVL